MAKALQRLGMPTAQDMQALQERVHALEEELRRLQGRRKADAADDED